MDVSKLARAVSGTDRVLVDKPDIEVAIYLVDYGFQVNVYNDTGELASLCKDFAGEYPVSDIADKAVEAIMEAMSQLEKRLRK